MQVVKFKINEELMLDTVAKSHDDLVYVVMFREEIYAVHKTLDGAKDECRLLCIVKNDKDNIVLSVHKLQEH